jgi:hypothetical protein
MPRKKKEPAKEPAANFTITLKLGDEIYSSSGESALDALEKLPHPGKIFLKGVLTLESNGNKWENPLPPIKVKRIFYPLARKYMAKQFALLVK